MEKVFKWPKKWILYPLTKKVIYLSEDSKAKDINIPKVFICFPNI